jgi:hypothetical protein
MKFTLLPNMHFTFTCTVAFRAQARSGKSRHLATFGAVIVLFRVVCDKHARIKFRMLQTCDKLGKWSVGTGERNSVV